MIMEGKLIILFFFSLFCFHPIKYKTYIKQTHTEASSRAEVILNMSTIVLREKTR